MILFLLMYYFCIKLKSIIKSLFILSEKILIFQVKVFFSKMNTWLWLFCMVTFQYRLIRICTYKQQNWNVKILKKKKSIENHNQNYSSKHNQYYESHLIHTICFIYTVYIHYWCYWCKPHLYCSEVLLNNFSVQLEHLMMYLYHIFASCFISHFIYCKYNAFVTDIKS